MSLDVTLLRVKSFVLFPFVIVDRALWCRWLPVAMKKQVDANR